MKRLTRIHRLFPATVSRVGDGRLIALSLVLILLASGPGMAQEAGTTARLAAAVAAFDYQDVPPQVTRYARQLIADSVAVAVGAHHVDTTHLLEDVLEVDGGNHLILHSGNRGKMLEAVYLNSLAANMLDFDDGHAEVGHPGVTAIQPALVLAERYDKSEEELLEAVIAGYEFNIRWARAVFSYADKFSGPWSSASMQVMGTTVMAAKLLDLNPEQIAQALFFAAANTPLPVYQKVGLHPGQTMSGLKNNYGQASHAGVMAVLTALAGVPAEPTVLDGDQGQWRMMAARAFDAEALFDGLGSRWEILDTQIKPYAACRWMHSSIDAFAQATANLTANDIEQVDVHLFKLGYNALGDASPSTLLELQFSMPHLFGLYLVGHTLIDLRLRDIHRAEGKSFSPKVRLHFDERYESLFADLQLPARVVITTVDGRQIAREVLSPRGERANPLTTKEHRAKVATLIESSPYPEVRGYAKKFIDWAGTD